MVIKSSRKEAVKVLLLEGVHDSAVEVFTTHGFTNVERLSGALQGEALAKKIRDTQLLGVRSRTQLTPEVLAAASQLMAVGCFCIGTNQVALTEAALLGIPVFNAPHSNTRSVAELVLGLVIMLLRDIFPKSCAAHEGGWKKSAAGSYEARGKVLGIVGYGHIGSQVSILAEAIGMQVCYYDIETKLPLGNARPVDTLEALMKKSDVVTLHVPETLQTQKMINAENLKLMRKGSCLINASRGMVVDIDALKGALDTGRLKGAAVDVFPSEPKENGAEFISTLRGMKNVILTPHIGGSTQEAQYNIGMEVSRKLARYMEYGSTEGAVNFPSLSLPPHEGAHRILHTHHNIPGILKQINKVVADAKINVLSQYLLTTSDIGYVVLDIEKGVTRELLDRITAVKGTIRARVLY